MNKLTSNTESRLEGLNKSEEKYQALFNSIDEGVCTIEIIFDEHEKAIDFRIIDINPAGIKLTGLNQDIVGKRIREILPGFQECNIEHFGQVVLSGKSIRLEEYVSALDSWFSYFALPNGGESSHEIAVIFQNITERKRSADILQRFTAWYKTILDLIPAGIWISDDTGKVILVNKEAVNMYRGVSPLAGRPEEYTSYKLFRHDTQEPVVFEPYPGKEALNGEVLDFERFDGTRGTLVASTEALRDQDGNIINYVAIAMDITPLRLAERALQESEKKALELVEKLRLADQNKNNFIKMLSHELRNPLASVMMGIDLLEKVIPSGKRETNTLEIVKRQAKQLNYLVDDLLDVTRIIQDKVALRKENVELNGLIIKSVQDYQALFSGKKVKVDLQLTTPLYIEADPSRITQAIDNLLDNAAKFTCSNDKVSITVAHDIHSNEAVITVQDTGCGIEPYVLANLFEPFVQADKTLARSDGGLGLGLAIVKGMVGLHGGRVEAFSEGIGKGAKFTIWLPLSENMNRIQERCIKPAIPNKSLKILAIDDVADLTEIMCQLICFLGYEAVAAHNGTDGITKARVLRPDVILCDIGLPGMSGYEVASFIRNDTDLKGTYLVALSGYVEKEDIERSMKAGFDRHLSKPVTLATLQMVLNEVQ